MPMMRAKFLVDTVHPDYGEVKKGEVLLVTLAYLSGYEDLGAAEWTEEPLSREEPEGASQRATDPPRRANPATRPDSRPDSVPRRRGGE